MLQVLAWRHRSLWGLQSDLCRDGAPCGVRRQDLHSGKGEHILKGLGKILSPGSKERGGGYACTSCSCTIPNPPVWLAAPQCRQPYLTMGAMHLIRSIQTCLIVGFWISPEMLTDISHLWQSPLLCSHTSELSSTSGLWVMPVIHLHSTLKAAESISLNQRTNSVNAI